jgi:hypothetical protein
MGASSKNILLQINGMINKEYEILEQKKFTTLTVGMSYPIKNIKFLPTRFGKAIVATLYDSVNNVTFKTFLPKRVVETLTEYHIDAMNNSDGKYTVIYLGQSPNQIGGVDKSKALLNFGYLE